MHFWQHSAFLVEGDALAIFPALCESRGRGGGEMGL